ncbi:asparagine synthase (glutamine-hydrolyzing) [Trichlorobacter lovleyi]|uniref:asparagine synthase (glutamine-hydrolyzing) n=1 Tax=Trichlorobacter lovleyi TaxID=313985 RepID=UPI00223F6AC0|nr:asparagine synthase (glutamine-hydrolyzing) [Trichlorobacter lovleyi]QOX78548.1 asparagine synthase (glutamine-hydrolyzing) [Trichlorobacter lovleyi]
MCGIAGYAGLFYQLGNTSDVLEKLQHRGPDDRGSVELSIAGKKVWLGQTRLSILDLSPAGHQPMTSKDGRWWVTYNGEIYNHLDIRKTLDGPFSGHSDTETLVEGLSQWGIDRLLSKLNGMFAFCAVDIQAEKMYLVRDPFGIKPLYYIDTGTAFFFASEVRALRSMPNAPIAIDNESLQTFLTLRYVPSPRTLWENIQRLPAGHCLVHDLATASTRLNCYIQPTCDKFQGTIDEAVIAYHEQLSFAVQRQLLSDVPVGILLSGGIDSALVAALAKERGLMLPCFSVGFGSTHKECELNDAAETASVLGFSHIPVTVSADELWDAVPRIVASVEEPLGTTSILPMWYLVRKARENVTVVLTGQGSDEPWGGYTRYQSEIVRNLLPFQGIWAGVTSFAAKFPNLPEFAERAFRSMPLSDIATRFEEAYALFSSVERQMLIGDSGDGNANKDIGRWLKWLEPTKCQPVEQMMRIDSRMNLSDDLLIYGDKISMATALETRVPMLDIELVRFIESLPIEYRVGLGTRKIVHKKMAQSFLPHSIVHRKKKGFQVPFGTWIRGEWQDRVSAVLFEANSPYSTIININAVKKLWDGHLRGAYDNSRKLYALFILAIWWKQQ